MLLKGQFCLLVSHICVFSARQPVLGKVLAPVFITCDQLLLE